MPNITDRIRGVEISYSRHRSLLSACFTAANCLNASVTSLSMENRLPGTYSGRISSDLRNSRCDMPLRVGFLSVSLPPAARSSLSLDYRSPRGRPISVCPVDPHARRYFVSNRVPLYLDALVFLELRSYLRARLARNCRVSIKTDADI